MNDIQKEKIKELVARRQSARMGGGQKGLEFYTGNPQDEFPDELEKFPDAVPVHSPVKGKMLWGIDVDDVSSAPTVGTAVTASEPVGFIQTYYGMEDVVPLADGKIAMTCVKQGENVVKGEIVAFIQR